MFCRSSNCTGFVLLKEINKKGPQIELCEPCRYFRHKSSNKNKEPILRKKNKLLQKKIKRINEKKRISRKAKRLQNKIETLKTKCAECKEDAVNEYIVSLTEEQQQAVRAIISTAKVKSKNGIRYNREWIYECILLRIKSCKAYEHLIKREIMALPCIKTLNNYMKFLKSQYGFQKGVFEGIKKKTENMPPEDVHGNYK
ncbi:uncharacterized protein LOC127285249 [Leptopilina boulardi]|uniref:uncharacterized protein LOC127285249 n=1 Tax=Leptopilina boulardi TaxID=63433 RepID=UPI0021F5F5D5|nr:uncharacterized protein LOC127285249 [Leptopilina boulardi]XP_051167108.1 uncharacterized protein LOC127285249 [Leptopilina boulardi]